MGGKVTGGPLTDFSNAEALALEGSQILVGGPAEGTFGALGVARLNGDGGVDTTFGNNGVASATFGNALQDTNDEVRGLAVGTNGLIYAVGVTGAGTSNLTGQAALASFSATGAVVNLRTVPLGTAAGGEDALNAIVPLPNGQLLVSGSSTASDNGSGAPPTTLVIGRINSDLSLDTSFAAGGLYHGPSGTVPPFVGKMAVTSDGAIVSVAGPFVVRLTANGQPDPTFGANGVATPLGQTGPTSPPAGSTSFFTWIPVAIDPITGNILVGGLEVTANAALTSGTLEGVLARLLSSSITIGTPAVPQSVNAIYVAAPQGRVFQHPVALVSVTNNDLGCFVPADYRITIRWGDGTKSSGKFGHARNGSLAVIGRHRYTHKGYFRTTVTIVSAATGATLDVSHGLIRAGGPSSAGHHRLIKFYD